MGVLDRFKRAMRDDITALAEDLAEDVATRWVVFGEMPMPAVALAKAVVLGRFELKERVFPQSILTKEKAAARELLADGFPESPRDLCFMLWEIEQESSFSPAHRGVHREKAQTVIRRTLQKHGLDR